MAQVFPSEILDREDFRRSGSLVRTFGAYDRTLVLQTNNSIARIECREKRLSTISVSCDYGDINIVAHCVATGRDTYNPFIERDFKDLRKHPAATRTFEQQEFPCRHLHLQYVGTDRFNLEVRGRTVPGSLVCVSLTEKHVRIVGSRMLTGAFLSP